MRRRCVLFAATSLTLLVVARVDGDDRPVVTVSRNGVSPARIEVHVGEIVSWRTTGGGRLRIQLDDHLGAHEVVERLGEVRGIFRRPGEHWYVGTLVDNGRRSFRATIVVREAPRAVDLPAHCADKSSPTICFYP